MERLCFHQPGPLKLNYILMDNQDTVSVLLADGDIDEVLVDDYRFLAEYMLHDRVAVVRIQYLCIGRKLQSRQRRDIPGMC